MRCTKCDRCGKEIDEVYVVDTFHGELGRRDLVRWRYDFCETCYNEWVVRYAGFRENFLKGE